MPIIGISENNQTSDNDVACKIINDGDGESFRAGNNQSRHGSNNSSSSDCKVIVVVIVALAFVVMLVVKS